MATLVVYPLSQITALAARSTAMPPPEAVASLEELARLVGAPGFSRAPVFRQGGGAASFENKQWENFRKFKPTVLVKTETKVEKAMLQVRTLLNKLSTANYDATVAELGKLFAASPLSGDETAELCDAIVAISGSNSYYAELYARMTESLLPLVPGLDGAITAAVASLRTALSELKHVPAADYDAFCAMNAAKDRRKGQGAYVICLAKLRVVEKEVVSGLVGCVVASIRSGMDDKEQRDHIDDMVSMLALFVTQGRSVLGKASAPETLLVEMSTMSRKAHPGLSSRALCACMDFCDTMAKLG
jgi:hypothetical protein